MNFLGELLTSAVVDAAKEALWGDDTPKDVIDRAKERLAKRPLSDQISQTIRRLEDTTSSRGASEKKRRFLASTEIRLVFMEVYGLRLRDSAQSEKSLSDLRLVFRSQARLYLEPIDAHELRDFCDSFFEEALAACDCVQQALIEDGNLAALDAREHWRYLRIQEQISALSSKLTKMADSGLSVLNIDEFVRQYLPAARDRFGKIVFPQIDGEKRLAIDPLYVPARLRMRNNGEPSPGEEVRYAELQDRPGRTVVLGNPGGGKSTLLTKICYDLARNRETNSTTLVPFLVTLRDYSAWREQSGRSSILEYIQTRACLQCSPRANVIEYLLCSGQALVALDGVDELLDPASRRDIRTEIEMFCRAYPVTAVIATSRVVGYEQAAFNEDQFRTLLLEAFDESDVERFVRAWFGLGAHLEEEVRHRLVEGFMRDSALVADLRTNPLLLTLMCNLYRSVRYIPQNRPEIYERCALLLFEQWDRSRGIAPSHRFEHQLGPIVYDIAHWIYSDGELQRGVSEKRIRDHVKSYLLSKHCEEEEEADAAADELVRHCRGRAWILCEVGEEAGQGIYRFVHRTFLEYFAAKHIARSKGSPREIMERLADCLERRPGDIVPLIAIQILEQRSDGGGDDALEWIIEKFERDPAASEHLVHFSLIALSGLVPRPATVRRVVTMAVEFSVSHAPERTRLRRTGHALLPLNQSRPENRNAIVDQLCKEIARRFAVTDPPIGIKAAWLPVILLRLTGMHIEGHARVEVIRRTSETLRLYARSRPALATECLRLGVLNADEFLDMHDVRAIFELGFVDGADTPIMPLVFEIVHFLSDGQDPDGDLVSGEQGLLAALGRKALRTRGRFPAKRPRGFSSSTWSNDGLKQNVLKLNTHGVFGFIVFVCLARELRWPWIHRFMRPSDPRTDLEHLMSSLGSGLGVELVSAWCQSLGLGHDQLQLVSDWHEGHLRFFEAAPREQPREPS